MAVQRGRGDRSLTLGGEPHPSARLRRGAGRVYRLEVRSQKGSSGAEPLAAVVRRPLVGFAQQVGVVFFAPVDGERTRPRQCPLDQQMFWKFASPPSGQGFAWTR